MSSSANVIRALLRSHVSVLADVDRDPGAVIDERILIRSDRSGTMQLYELVDGALSQLTDLPEPVSGAHYVDGRPLTVLEVDAGGNERTGLLLLDLLRARRAPVRSFTELDPLTDDPAHIHRVAGVRAGLVAYTSNRANGVDFDLWTVDLSTREHTIVHAAGTWLAPASGFGPDNRTVSLLAEGLRGLDNDVLLVDAFTGDATVLLPHPEAGAEVGAPAWVGHERGRPGVLVAANTASDTMRIHRQGMRAPAGGGLPAPDGAAEELALGDPRWDADVVASRDGTRALVIVNQAGQSAMCLVDPDDAAAPSTPVPLAEPGVAAPYGTPRPRLTPYGRRVYYTLSSPRIPGDVFAYDVAGGATRRLTESPLAVAAETLVVPETVAIDSFDGERVPAFVYRPPDAAATAERPPVVVLPHGGPEAQSMLTFNPVVQGLALAGYGVIVPNVRGSTGYGKRYAALDDTVKRLDSVRDLAAIHGALDGLGFDPARAALWGGSYGGYMVLAGLAFQPELWAAAVDIVGISDLVTFLQNTSAYRRAYREREYGSLEHDREFLASASPMSRVDAIRAPLFVIHGRNDPRVPVSEAEQLVARLREREVRCELVIYEDEGHGLARLENRLDAYPRAVAFLDDVLGTATRPASSSPPSADPPPSGSADRDDA